LAVKDIDLARRLVGVGREWVTMMMVAPAH